MSEKGRVEAIYTAPEAGAPMRHVEHVRAVPGLGLEGDRYYNSVGSFSRWPGPHREVTLISVEALEAMALETGVLLLPEHSRRNLLIRDVALNDFIGRIFYVGSVRMKGLRLCQPCKYLAGLVDEPDLVPAMRNRGGLRAEILSEGIIRTGDTVRLDTEAPASGRLANLSRAAMR
jgi:MOSC domain-containing protein YiiM